MVKNLVSQIKQFPADNQHDISNRPKKRKQLSLCLIKIQAFLRNQKIAWCSPTSENPPDFNK